MNRPILNVDDLDYPDTGTFGVLAEFPAGPDGKPEVLRFIGRARASLDDYWEGE